MTHPARPLPTGAARQQDALRDVARTLSRNGRHADAVLILDHLNSRTPGEPETLQLLAGAQAAEGRLLEAIETLLALRSVACGSDGLVAEIRSIVPHATQAYNDRLATGDLAGAESYAAALAALVPGHSAFLNSAMACNIGLGRRDEAARYAGQILSLEPEHAAARAVLAQLSAPDEGSVVDARFSALLHDAGHVHPLLRLRDIHDLVSTILCRDLDVRGIAQIEALLKTARSITLDLPAGSEWEGWAKHYRLALEATDPAAALAPTPAASPAPDAALATSSGDPLEWPAVQERAQALGARTVFFAAADASYVDLYARWYINSILEHCDVSCLVIVHVVGGRGRLREIARSVGVASERLIYAGDDFDAANVATRCYDTPPKGLIARPVAHYQSVRFLALGAVLERLGIPVFVSDIDLLLQRGVSDLLERCAGADIVLNENTHSTSAGSRYTANLLLANPTANAAVFARFLRGYLERALGGRDVTRWIDQFALMQARHHLSIWAAAPRIAYFDTSVDINNVMYRSYQNHPFRFLSLYHGFDMSSLAPA